MREKNDLHRTLLSVLRTCINDRMLYFYTTHILGMIMLFYPSWFCTLVNWRPPSPFTSSYCFVDLIMLSVLC